jgi:MFS superfamily sulfate permease-like transporter
MPRPVWRRQNRETDRALFMLKLRWMTIVWPAFLLAGVLEVLVFSMVDPQDFRWMSHNLGWSNQAIYTVMFFLMWACTLVTSGLTAVLSLGSDEVNKP